MGAARCRAVCPLVTTVLLALAAAIPIGIWWQHINATLDATRYVASLIEVPLSGLLSNVMPRVFTATLVVTVLLVAGAMGLAVWRFLLHRRAAARGAVPLRSTTGYLAAGAGLNALLYLLTLWLALMFAVTTIFFAAALISARSTLDAAKTLEQVDPQIHMLINSAFGGAVDTSRGFTVTVNDRDVDIGHTTCSLFCFVLARAMLADDTACTCDTLRMYQIHKTSTEAMEQHIAPALIASLIALLALLGLWGAGASAWAVTAAQRRAAAGGLGAFACGRRHGGQAGSTSSDDVGKEGQSAYASSGILVDGTDSPH